MDAISLPAPARAGRMKRVCAWCVKHLGGDPGAALITHGICLPCLATVRAELSASRASRTIASTA